jgi:N-acetylglucosamine-6-phosphate deacetylase
MNYNMKAYINAQIFNGEEIVRDAILLTEDKKVIDIVPSGQIPSEAQVADLQNNYIAPAFIDLQIYGGNGKLFSQELSVDSLKATYEYCLSGGAAWFLPALATNSIEIFIRAIDIVKEYWQQGGKGVPGLHLEGPYINPLKKGAHIESCIKKPTMEEVSMLLRHGRDVIKMITLAPEQCDAEIIKLLADNNVIVSAGHSNATYAQAMEGFNNGITAATHLFNAMSAFAHRAPGLPGALFDHPSVRSSIVPDGIHVDYAVLRTSKKVMKERLFIITDAVTETIAGGYIHKYQGDRYTLPDGTLSGSALTMMKGVKNCIEHAGIPVEEALRMASLYPAAVIGKENVWGRIAKGYNAEFVVFDHYFAIKEVITS